MKILVVLPNLAGGGAERMHIYLANEWAKYGHEVTLCLLEEDGVLKKLVDDSVKIKNLKCSRIRDSFFALMKIFSNEKPDIIVPAMWPVTTISIFAKIFSGIKSKTFLVEHCAYEKVFAKLLGYPLFLIGFSKSISYIFARRIISVSKGVEESIRNITFLPKEKFKVIYNGIPIYNDLVSSKAELFKTDKKVILAVGTLKKRKDYTTIIKALYELRKKGNDHLKLFILGDGPTKEEIENEIQNLKLIGNVELLGFKENVYPYMKAADLFVHSSEVEGFALVIAEALSCGTNVVSTDTPHGPSEILENGKYGSLVQIGDEMAMADAIMAKINNPIKSNTLRSRAEAFSISQCAQLYLEEFK